MTTTTLFDISVRVVECAQCGAPIEGSLTAGEVKCRYCSAPNRIEIRRRRESKRGAARVDEAARQAALWAQVYQPTHGHEYDMWTVPPGLQSVTAAVAMLDRRAVQAAWFQQKAAVGTAGASRRICFTALVLSRFFERESNPTAARATLETALDLLDDEGHRDLLHCRLATAAVYAGELHAAGGWLEQCDPSPLVLEIDGEQRYARSLLALAQGDWQTAVSIADLRRPTDPPHRADLLAVYRIAEHHLIGARPTLGISSSEIERIRQLPRGEPVAQSLASNAEVAKRSWANSQAKGVLVVALFMAIFIGIGLVLSSIE